MNDHRCEVAGAGLAGYDDQTMERSRIVSDALIGKSTSRRYHDLGAADVWRSRVFALLESHPIACGRCAKKFWSRVGRNDSNDRAGFMKAERLPGTNWSGANHDNVDLLANQCDGERAQRNCPLSSEAARKTTYIASTLTNVTVDTIAARRA